MTVPATALISIHLAEESGMPGGGRVCRVKVCSAAKRFPHSSGSSLQARLTGENSESTESGWMLAHLMGSESFVYIPAD